MHGLGGNRHGLDRCRRRARVAPASARPQAKEVGFSFVQISDSHIGFDKPANPDVAGHAQRGVGQDRGLAGQAGLHDPYRRHHPSRRCPQQFDDARQEPSAVSSSTSITRRASTTFSTPRPPRPTWSASAKARATAAITPSTIQGVHFISLNNVIDLKKNGLGFLGAGPAGLAGRRSARKDRLRRRSSCSAISRCGPSRRNGAGAPRIPQARWRCWPGSARSPCSMAISIR